MKLDVIHLHETDSTNQWLERRCYLEDLVVWANHQTAGRGSGLNTWEDEPGKNLLFSILIHPLCLRPSEQFRISMAISLAIVRALQPLVNEGELSIKWPNDIYWNDRKLCGILIENQLSGQSIRESIIGVGLNVNQTVFTGSAPNPVSLCQITGHEHDRRQLLDRVVRHFTLDINPADYHSLLYRREGLHTFCDEMGLFKARMEMVEDDGHLLLCDGEGRQRRYAFKEVQFII